jgi:hypothetical protein
MAAANSTALIYLIIAHLFQKYEDYFIREAHNRPTMPSQVLHNEELSYRQLHEQTAHGFTGTDSGGFSATRSTLS